MSNTPIQALHNYHQTAKSLNLAKRIELKELLGITEVCRIVKTESYARGRRKTPLGLRAKHLSRSRVQPLPS